MKNHSLSRFLCAAALLCLLCVCAFASPVSCALAESDGFIITDGVLTGYTGSETSIVIPSSARSIGDRAFAGNTQITSVTFSSSLASVGSEAFSGCTSLRQITEIKYIRSIGSGAFQNCSALISIDLSLATITALQENTFAGCTGLRSISLPANITSIAANAFDHCDAAFYCNDGSATQSALSAIGKSGAPISAPGLTFTYYGNMGWSVTAFDGSVKDVVIPEGTETIHPSVFKDSAITSVSFPATLKTIQWNAFQNCTSLTAVDIPASVQVISSSTFDDCLNLRSVTLHEGLEKIEGSAFSDCTNLPSIDIPQSVKSIGSNAFYNCLSLSSVTLREGLESLYSYAFYRCIALKSISLPQSLKTLEADAFNNSGITSIILPENMSTVNSSFSDQIRAYVSRTSQTAYAMARKPNNSVCSFTDPQWPDFSLYYLINEYTGEKSLHLYKYHSVSDVSVTVPDGIAGIYRNAFFQYNPDGTPQNTVLEEIILPDSVTSIGSGAFSGCATLKRIYLPDNVASFGTYIATANRNLQLLCSRDSLTARNITDNVYAYGFTDPDAPDFSWAYEAGGDGLILTGYRGASVSVSVPDGATIIGSSAFYENKKLKTVVLPEGVTHIRSAAFQYCSSLASITFPSTLISVGDHAFNGCDALKSVTLPAGVTALGANSFVCPLEEIHLPDNITTVGTYPFYDSCLIFCKEGSVTAHNVSAENTGYRLCDPANPDWKYRYNDDGGLVFGGYRGSKTEITIPDIYVGISSYAFSNNNTLKKVIIPESVVSLGYSSLSGSVEEFHLPDNITQIDAQALPSWNDNILYFVSRTSKTFENLRALGIAFTLCDSAEPDWLWRCETDGTLSLGGYLGKSSAITLPSGASAVAAHAFDDYQRYKHLLSITIPEGYTTIKEYAFEDTFNVQHLSLPSSLRTIEKYAFGCHFSMIQLPEGLESIGKYAFWGCHNLTSLTIPSTVKRIPHVIAEDCDDLTTVVLPREIEEIADGAFGDALSTVYCYKNTYGHTWAKDNALMIKLIDEDTFDGLVRFSGPDEDRIENRVFEVGQQYPFMTGVSVGVLPSDADYTFVCESSNPSIARVDGNTVTFLNPGKVTLTISIAERPDVTPLKRNLEVYLPVTDFTVPSVVLTHIDAWADNNPSIIRAENIVPAQHANPYFSWESASSSGSWRHNTGRGISFWPEDRVCAIRANVISYSGVSRPILFITYDQVEDIAADAPDRALSVGEIWEPRVIVTIDGAQYENVPSLYTLKSSNTSVASITDDNRIQAITPGTATITVTSQADAKKVQFSITVIKPVILILPDSVSSVEEEAFAGIAASQIILPEGCRSIGPRAFADCTQLTSITIPASVTEIADDAFDGCSGVTIVTSQGSAADTAFSNKSGFTVLCKP